MTQNNPLKSSLQRYAIGSSASYEQHRKRRARTNHVDFAWVLKEARAIAEAEGLDMDIESALLREILDGERIGARAQAAACATLLRLSTAGTSRKRRKAKAK